MVNSDTYEVSTSEMKSIACTEPPYVRFQAGIQKLDWTWKGTKYVLLSNRLSWKADDIERGRQLFFNVAKSSCLKCHRLKDQTAQQDAEKSVNRESDDAPHERIG